MLSETEAAVVVDSLYEQGHAVWPGVGRFALVSFQRPDRTGATGANVHVFPERFVEFEPEAAPAVDLSRGPQRVAGLGTFFRSGDDARPSFEPDDALLDRVRRLPLRLFRVVPEPPSVPRAPALPTSAPRKDVEGDAPRRSWWQRL